MDITKKLVPHEFLFRFTDAGLAGGAHIQDREVFVDENGAEQFSRFADPRPITLDDAQTLAVIGAAINAAQAAELADTKAELDDTKAKLADANKSIVASDAQSANLQAQLNEALLALAAARQELEAPAA